MLVVGCDPGLSGALAVLDRNGLRGVFDLPTMPIPGVGPKALVQRKIDGRALLDLLLKACPAGEARPTIAIEAVGTMGGANNAVQTQGSLLRSLGAIETVAECLKCEVVYVQPLVWKRAFGLIDANLSGSQRKNKALETARRCFPASTDFRLAKHHNRAEAALLARHAQMELA